MVSIWVTTFIFIITLLHGRESNAETDQVMEDKLACPINVKKEFRDGDPPPPAAAESTQLGGRKMVFKRSLEKAEDAINGEDSKNSSGAGHDSVGILNVEHSSSLRDTRSSLHQHHHHHHHPVKLKTAGFTAFSADYNVPKPHPPTHN